MNFHKKIVVYYYGILFILEINAVLRKFILWDQSLSKGLFCDNSEGLRYFENIFSLSRTFYLINLLTYFVNKY